MSHHNGSTVSNVFDSSGLTVKPAEEQVHTLVYFMGDKADNVQLAPKLMESKKRSDDVLQAFEKNFVLHKIITYERATFFRREQIEGERVEFVNRLPLTCRAVQLRGTTQRND